MPEDVPRAQLSSMATVLDELAARVTVLADRYSGTEQDDVAHDLYAVERALKEALRRLRKLSAP
jgi:hypothetical protein